MSKSIFIVGTSTDIGKTFVAGGIINALNKENKNVCYFKPVQSGIASDEDYSLTDVDFIKRVSSLKQDTRQMNTYSFKEALSPHLAAKREDTVVDIEEILKKYRELKNKYDYIVIEGAGGVIVPITEDYYIYDLIKDMKSEVIVVADSRVGSINHTCLTIDFLKRQNIDIKAVVINRYKGKFYEGDNIKMIERISNIKAKLIIKDIDVKDENIDKNDFLDLIKQEYDRSFTIEKVLKLF